jgi:folylpolyglutamate synthase/dihydropteroate synthase
LRKGLAMASVDDVLLVTGSLYTVGEAKAWWDLREAR